MTKERKMELSLVNSYGAVAMQDILDKSREEQLNQEVENERIAQRICSDPSFTDQLLLYAGISYEKLGNTQLLKTMKSMGDNLPDIPVFLSKYVE